VFGYYNMVGYLSQAAGAVFAGFFLVWTINNIPGTTELSAMRNVVRIYALLGAAKFVGYYFMDRNQIEPHQIKDKSLITCTGIRK
jgi:NAD/NADP transhydrogenase alpha subunit